jgi:pSer/pThr/pTyr-binding forkhead associated (FHA) protein
MTTQDEQPISIDIKEEINHQLSKKADSAYFILENQRVVLIDQDVFNIGRRIENNLTLDDPRVSRIHAQLRLIRDHYILFDLGSTGGTFINGRRIEQSIIYSGDVISLAGMELIFAQDSPPPRPDLKETDKFRSPGK